MDNKDYEKLYKKYKKKYLNAKKNILINLPIGGAAAAIQSKESGAAVAIQSKESGAAVAIQSKESGAAAAIQSKESGAASNQNDDNLWQVPNSLFELGRKVPYAGKYKLSASQLHSYNNRYYRGINSSRATLLQQNFPTSFKICLNKFGNELLKEQGKSIVKEHFTKDDVITKLVDSMPLLCGNGPSSNKAAYRIKIGDYHEVVMNNRTGESNRPLIRDFIDEKSGKVRYTFYRKFQKAIIQSLDENAIKFGFPTVKEYLNSLTPFEHSLSDWIKAITDEINMRCITQSGTLHEAEEINETNGCGGVYNFSGAVGGIYEPDLRAPNENKKIYHKLEGDKYIIFGMFDGRVTKAQYMQNAKPIKTNPGNPSFFKFGGLWKTGDNSVSRVSHIYEAKERQWKFSGIKESEMVQIAVYHQMIKKEEQLALPVMLVETKAVINKKLGYRESAFHIKDWKEGEAEGLVTEQVNRIIGWLDGLKEAKCQSVRELIISMIW